MDFNTVGSQFLELYYSKFDNERAALSKLYRDSSMLSFEGEQYKGIQNIMGKYSSFGKVVHKITRFDIQPSIEGGVICFVIGELRIDENPLLFSQVFHICKFPTTGEFFCLNDIFRLNLVG